MIKQGAWASAVAMAGAIPANAQDQISWDRYAFFDYAGESDYTVSVPTEMFLPQSDFSQYYPDNIRFTEHYTSVKTFGLRFTREWESNPNGNGRFVRWGGGLRYSQASGYAELHAQEFVDHVSAGISRDLYGVWSEYSGQHRDRISQADMDRAVSSTINGALDYLAANPDASFDASSIDIPDNLSPSVQAEIRSALEQVERQADRITSSDAFEHAVEVAQYRQNNHFDLDRHTLGIDATAEIGYRLQSPNGTFGVESFDTFVGGTVSYEAHYLDLGDFGGGVCHGPAASIHAGVRANMANNHALSLGVKQPLDIAQPCMGGAIRELNGGGTKQWTLEYSVSF